MTSLEEPLPLPEQPTGPPLRKIGLRRWLKENLFSSLFNGALTVVFGLFLVWVFYRLGRFVLADARWEIIERNITNLMVFHFDRDELWRPWAALFILAAAVGLAIQVVGARRLEQGTEAPVTSPTSIVRRTAPLLILVGVLLLAARSVEATILTLGVAATALAFRYLGKSIPGRLVRLVIAAGILATAAAYIVLTGFGGVAWDDWGGLLLTVFLAVSGILLSFPLGVLLALGRRSNLPVVRWVCIVYIELIRGVPLITILFMSAFALGFFLPPGTERPSLVTRAIVALVVFTAAYVAEIVRGGLQGVPQGQIEAAQALGLSPVKTTRLIVLPQALRAVIPALVGQFISLFKDTSLVFIVGLTELLAVTQAITKQPDFLAQGLIVETLVFAAFVYWAGAYWMSRESQRLEQRLGVGVR